jgi:antitoxin component YwqK of YwqJK toxin-antitoxin module
VKKIIFFTLLCFVSLKLFSQGYTRQTFHDREKRHLKEVYQVKDTIQNVLQGRYISYYLNGNIESKGQFTNNETTGVWEFFYETGNLKMRGILRQNANYGLWEYFYESGQKSMEGNINGKNREGEWKTYYENGQIKDIGEYRSSKRDGPWKSYFEDGTLKGEIDYTDDYGIYTEYYHSGKVLANGPRLGSRNVGLWRFFAEDGTLQSEGEFHNGKKNGEWKNFFSTGKTYSTGFYDHDLPVGKWEFYFEDGAVSSSGEYTAGKRTGYWKTMNQDKSLKSEISYENGAGEYREYYSNGKLRAKGRIVNDKKDGKWEYFYDDGKLEGDCDFDNGRGEYTGYFPDGNVKTKGTLDGDLKIGAWELYEEDGKLAGYYRPFYDDKKSGKKEDDDVALNPSPRTASKRRTLSHFDARFNEFRGVILGTNPLLVFAGRLPASMEFYLQERLGHEFEFIGIRNPFFRSDANMPAGKIFERGYAICVKQKLYNQVKAGMWYFGHEIRFTNVAHFINEPLSPGAAFLTYSAIEQRIEYGPLIGYRIMKKNNAKGFTVDAFASANVGYRGLSVDSNYDTYFKDIKRSKISGSLHFGLNFGHVFSFR